MRSLPLGLGSLLLLAACSAGREERIANALQDAGKPGRDASAQVDEEEEMSGEVVDAAPAVVDAARVDGAVVDARVADAAGPVVRRTTAVDLLFVIDNSGSMAKEQLKLAQELPDMVASLTSGGVNTLHLGVVSTNAGGMSTDLVTTQVALASCAGLGDDGKLLNSTTVAVEGVVANQSEFVGYAKDSVVLPPLPTCALDDVPTYQQFDTSDPKRDAVIKNFRCVSAIGVRGCPFEQPLEAMWKALAPSTGSGELHEFIDGSRGQADRHNAGFLRDEAVLAVLLVTDEDDCSITDAGKPLFEPSETATTQWGQLNLRCGKNSDNRALVRPVTRYVEGLRTLKPNAPDQVVLAAITGVPPDAIASKQSYREILARADMQFEENPASPGFPTASCASEGGEAYPARRVVELFEALPDQSLLFSICEDDYGPAIKDFTALITKRL